MSQAAHLSVASLLMVVAGTIHLVGQQPQTNPGEKGRQGEIPNIKFTKIVIGDGLTSDHIRIYYTKYKDTEGTILYEVWVDFRMPERAAKELQQIVSDSARVVRREPELDAMGGTVGERILVQRADSKKENRGIVLAWTVGSVYREISSNSLDDVLAFEKQFRPPETRGQERVKKLTWRNSAQCAARKNAIRSNMSAFPDALWDFSQPEKTESQFFHTFLSPGSPKREHS
jgi:hypothetical protein